MIIMISLIFHELFHQQFLMLILTSIIDNRADGRKNNGKKTTGRKERITYSRCKIQIHILGIEREAQQRHVILPAHGGCERELHAPDGGRDGPERGRRALGPNESLSAGLWGAF